MKNFYLLIIAVLFCSLIQAQVKKGDIVLGGNVGYSNQASSSNPFPANGGKSDNLSINPSIGKAIKDNLVIGIDLFYSRYTYSNGAPSISPSGVSNAFETGVFVRRYKPLGNNFFLFAQTTFMINYSHGTSDAPAANGNLAVENEDKSIGFGFQFYPGISYAINRHWQLETGLPNLFSVNYNHTKFNTNATGQPNQDGSSHSFAISSSLTGNNEFAVGVRYFIGG
jgi:hypothetical protein